jgi:hypothetical protein
MRAPYVYACCLLLDALPCVAVNLECLPGKYSSLFSQTGSCYECPKGQFQKAVGQSSCIDCAPGKYAHPGAVACKKCAAGSFDSPFGDHDLCYGCPKGHFSLAGQTSCTPCPAGKFQATAGLASCVACNAGYQSRAAATSAASCAPPSAGKCAFLCARCDD